MTHSAVSYLSTRKLQVIGLQDNEGTYQNDATVTLESLTERDTGDAVSGISVPATVTYVAASSGDYELDIAPSVGFVVGGVYLAQIKAVGSQGYEKQWTETIRCKAAVA